MSPFRRVVVAVVVVAATGLSRPEAAHAGQREVAGEVVRSAARYVGGGAAIVTDAVVRTADGEVTVRQLGGTVDGIAMRVSHAPPLLAVGDRTALRAELRRDLAGRGYLAVSAIDRLEAAAPGDRAERADFVRTVNARGGSLYWDSSCVFVAYATEGTSHIAGDGEFAVMDAVLARWTSDTRSCGYLTFEREGRLDREIGNDGVDVIKFREDSWCRPASADDPGECYDPDAAAITTLWFVNDAGSDANGQIFDADIEFNAVNFTIAVDGETTRPGGGCVADLANTLTHEVGHLLGLDHTCWNPAVLPQPRDDQGNLVPSCNGAVPAEAQNATMYAFQDCGETSKASPEPDDLSGFCAIYPLADDPGECRRPDGEVGGCCAVAGRRAALGPGVFSLASLAMLALIALRRRR